MKNFLVNPEDGTVNIHYDNLNPADILELIERLKCSCDYIKNMQQTVIEIMEKSCKLNKAKNEISFHLSWDAEAIIFNLDNDDVQTIEFNVILSNDDDLAVRNLLTTMIDSLN